MSIVRITGLTSGQPVLVESPPMEGTSTSPLGSKKRRGQRGPDKNPTIDPITGKRRYIKRKNKSFGSGYDLMDFDFVKKEKKKRNLKIPRVDVDMRGLKKKHRNQDHDLHNRHSSDKYSSEEYITPSSREEESEAEIGDRSQEVSERVEVMDSVWSPTDDLRLIMNMLQTKDLREVQLGTKFSRDYSLEELALRWDYILFDDSIGKVSHTAIRNLPVTVKTDICSKALFSIKENALLQEIASTSNPKHLLPVMKRLLDENPLVFLKSRVPRDLIRQWLHLRDFHLLSDQDVSHYFAQRNFEDFEMTINDQDLQPSPFIDEAVQQEKLIQKRINRKKIQRLEQELQLWLNISEKANVQPIFKTDAYAMLRGKSKSYFMNQTEMTFGRRTDSDEDQNIDADLTLEGSVYKISRRQGIISLREDGQFVILNEGKHTIYVDGKPLFPKTVGPLRDRSVIEVSLLSFVFVLLCDHEFLKKEAERMKGEKSQKMDSAIFGSIPRSISPSLYLPPHISSHLASSLSSSGLTSTMVPTTTISNVTPSPRVQASEPGRAVSIELIDLTED